MRSALLYRCLLGIGAAIVPACSDAQLPTLSHRYDFERHEARFEMPTRLDEISGLAFTADGRLFTHDDEEGVVYEVDVTTGLVAKGFSLGENAIRADFEGIAVVGERFFLTSSTGILYEFREGLPGSSVSYRETDTGLGDRCEVEGLAHHDLDVPSSWHARRPRRSGT